MDQGKKHIKKDLYNILIVSFLVLLLTLPFINKAFHIDDLFFIPIGVQLIEDPFRPYSFNLHPENTSGISFISDPPLISYYIALIMFLFGSSEWVLHLSFIIFPLIIGISMYFISKRFTDKPLFPTLLLISSAAFLVNAHNIMLDVPFLALFLLSIAFFIRGIDSNKGHLIFLGAFFCGLVYLVKYTGLILIPLLALYALYKKKFKALVYLIVPIIIIFLWNFYTYVIYGIPHFYEVLVWLFQAQSSTSFTTSIMLRFITNLTFIGGATLFPLMLLYPFLLKNRNKLAYFLIVLVTIIISVALYFVSVNFAFRYTLSQLIMFTFFLSTGSFFLFVFFKYHYFLLLKIYRSGKPFINKYNSDDIYLLSWFLIGYLFISTVGGGAVRYLTIILPPMVILYLKIIEKYKVFNAESLKKFFVLGIILTSTLSIVIAYTDYEFANATRNFAGDIGVYKNNENNIWFNGRLSFKYYMEEKDYIALGLMDNSPKMGDIVVRVQMPFPRDFSPLLEDRMILLDTKSYGSNFPLRIHNAEARAGFYAYGAGFLPYSFSRSSLENFDIYMVVR